MVKLKKPLMLLGLLFLVSACSSSPKTQSAGRMAGAWHYPPILNEAIQKLRRHYPQLQEVPIHFQFDRDFSDAIMQAQPRFLSMLNPTARRRYQIEMQPYLLLREDQDTLPLPSIPDPVLLGWLGHELGHIADYENKGWGAMLGLGLGYLFSESSLRATEQRADSIATRHGLGPEIIAVKNFILKEKAFPEGYRQKIRDLYPTTSEIEALLPE